MGGVRPDFVRAILSPPTAIRTYISLMLKFGVRPTGLSDDPNDFVLRCNGVDVGRCYLRYLTSDENKWSWSIYIGIHVKRTVEGVPLAGYANSLDLAKQQFQEAFGRLYEEGVVALPDR
jgi:hypothetical protein